MKGHDVKHSPRRKEHDKGGGSGGGMRLGEDPREDGKAAPVINDGKKAETQERNTSDDHKTVEVEHIWPGKVIETIKRGNWIIRFEEPLDCEVHHNLRLIDLDKLANECKKAPAIYKIL